MSFLGVGGVGKTTYIYRLLGLSRTPRVTRRPQFYALRVGDMELFLLDAPGQYAAEVVALYNEAVKTYGAQIDLIAYMYDVTDRRTLEELLQLAPLASYAPRKILIGNKRDLAEERGTFVRGEEAAKALGATRVYYTSALKDSPDTLLKVLLEGLSATQNI
nr:GTPase domain-containing protein [Pyrobaculum calidifontis]